MIYIVTGENDYGFSTFTVEADSDLEAYAKIFREKLEAGYDDDFDDDFDDDDDFDLDEYLEDISETYNDGEPVNKQWFNRQFAQSDVCSGTGFAIISIAKAAKCSVIFNRS